MSVYYSEYIPVSSGSGIEGRSLIDLTSTSFADLFSQAAAYSSGTTYTKGTLVYDQDAVWVYINASSSSGNAPPTLPTISDAYWELVSRNSPPSLSAYLTNESIQLFAYANGSVVDYGGATGSFKVFSGNTDISSNFTIDDVINDQGLTIDFVGQVYTVTAGFDANEDTASVTIRATGSGAYVGIVLDKVLTLSKAKGGYEIVPILPSTNLFEGRVVFLTADDRLYRYNGSTWTAANPSGSANMLSGVMPGINPNRFAYISYNPDSKPYANNGFGNMLSSTGAPFAGTTAFSSTYELPGYEVFGLWQTDGTAGGVGLSHVVLGRVTDLSGTININWSVEAGKTYEFSVYTGAERCNVEAFIIFVNSSGTFISETTPSTNNRELSGAGNSLSSFKRLVSRGVAPIGAVNAICVLRKYHTTQDLGFTDSLMFAARPMLIEAQAGATDVTPWSPPSVALFYAENIVAGSITGAKLSATDLIITQTAQIKDLTVTTLKIAGNAVTAPYAASTSSALFLPSAPDSITDILSLSVTPSNIDSVYLSLSADMGNTHASYSYIAQFQITINGSLVFTSENILLSPQGISGNTGFWSHSGIFPVSVGVSNTIILRVKTIGFYANTQVRVTNRSVFALELKR